MLAFFTTLNKLIKRIMVEHGSMCGRSRFIGHGFNFNIVHLYFTLFLSTHEKLHLIGMSCITDVRKKKHVSSLQPSCCSLIKPALFLVFFCNHHWHRGNHLVFKHKSLDSPKHKQKHEKNRQVLDPSHLDKLPEAWSIT